MTSIEIKKYCYERCFFGMDDGSQSWDLVVAESFVAMGDKKKKATLFIRLVSAAGTGFFYVKKKPSRMVEKLEFRKYDPRVNRHVLFTEAKMK
ncbi:hypothetical protein ACLB2K_040049 [Fragaria x ananassa]